MAMEFSSKDGKFVFPLSLSTFIDKWIISLRQIGMSRNDYIKQVVIPFSTIAIIVPIFAFFFNDTIPYINLAFFSMFFVPLMIVLIFIAPTLKKETYMRKAEEKLPILLTQMSILSTSHVNATILISTTCKMKEFGPLTNIMRWVNTLITRFRLPASEALQKVAEEVASARIEEFLERFSHALSVGEDPMRFLINEQDVAMDEFSTTYSNSLKEVEGVKDSMASLITAALFLATFLMLVPIITGLVVSEVIMVTLFVFIFIEGFEAFIILSKLPREDIWYKPGKDDGKDIPLPATRNLHIVVTIGAIFVVILAFLILPTNLAFPMKVSFIITPLLLPGIIISIEEQRIKDREHRFAPFIRALGRTREIKGESFVGNMRRLSIHEFGNLNMAIKRLTRRLSTRVKVVMAWRHFSAETGSNLITRYSEMFIQGSEMGGDPREISRLIEINLATSLDLRQDRYQMAGALTGMFYGLVVAIAFTLYISLNLLKMMGAQVAKMPTDVDSALATSFITNLANVGPLIHLLTIMITFIIVIHAFVSSMVIARLKGGHPVTGYVHFVGQLWCGTVTAFATNSMVSSVM